jgi:hypothetical protein
MFFFFSCFWFLIVNFATRRRVVQNFCCKACDEVAYGLFSLTVWWMPFGSRHSGGVVGILFRTNEKERLARKSSPENAPEAKNQKIGTKSEKRTRLRLA